MADYASDIVFSEGTSFCLEDETDLRLWRAAFPAEYRDRVFSVSELLGSKPRSETRAERLALFQTLLSPDQLPRAQALLGSLEILRGALILSHEDVDYCFTLLATTPKNLELKTLLHRYLDSPLAADEAHEIWDLVEKLKNHEASFPLGPRVVFVRGLDNGFLFNELANHFSYAEGVDEVVLANAWEIPPNSAEKPHRKRPPVLFVGNRGDCLLRLGEHVLHLIERGIRPEEIHVPFHGSKALKSWLRYFLEHHHIPTREIAPLDSSPAMTSASSVTRLVAALRKDSRRELKDRLKLGSLLLRDQVGRTGAMDWDLYLGKLETLTKISELDRSYLTTLLCETAAEASAPDSESAETGVLFSPFTLLPGRLTLGFADQSLFHDESAPSLLKPQELEALSRGGFAVATASSHRSRTELLIAGFCRPSPHRRFLFSPAAPASLTWTAKFRPIQRSFEARGPGTSEVPFESQLIPLPLKPLSATALETYARCPAQYLFGNRFRLRPQEQGDSVYPLLFGQAVHLALENFFRLRASSPVSSPVSPPVSIEEQFGLAVKSLAPTLAADHPLFTILAENFRRISRKLPLLEAQLAELFGAVRPTDFEKPFELHVDGILLRGKIDRIDTVQGEAALILDYKTGAVDFSPNHILDGSHFQALIYLLAGEQLFDKPCAGLIFYDLKKGELRRGLVDESRLAAEMKKKLTRGHSLPADKLAELKEKGLARLKELAGAILSGDFTPRPSSSACGSCSYAALCRKGYGYHA